MKTLGRIALALIIIGAINWGLIGIFNFNVISVLFGSATTLSRVIYAIVGISAIVFLANYAVLAAADDRV